MNDLIDKIINIIQINSFCCVILFIAANIKVGYNAGLEFIVSMLKSILLDNV